MAEIIFQSRMEARKFYQHLLNYLTCNGDEDIILLFEDRHIVEILDSRFLTENLNRMKKALYDYITTIKRNHWLRDIIKTQFYFEDAEEQQQIMEIIYSILEGQREDLAVFLKERNEETACIENAIDDVFQENVSFSFDSLLKFRLRPYMKILEEYVELAIDEYKMEQEYQMFVSMLRDFLKSREPKIETLHLLFDEEITFYNDEFIEIKRSELIKLVDRKLLVNHPVYVDSVSIAPLLSLAPTTIFIYTKEPDEPLVRTIKNIFEERVRIKTYRSLKKIKKRSAENNSSEHHG